MIVPEGTIKAKDLTGEALPDATVNIIDPLTDDILATTTTDANGYYQVLVPAGGPYLLQAVKDGIKVQQFTPQVEVGIEYALGTADCSTTAVALIAQAMLEDDSYPDDPADINLADIEADLDFDDVLNLVCGVLGAGEDPAVSAVVQQAVEDFLHPPTPTPTPHPTPAATLESIAITTPASKLSYSIDAVLDITGLVVTGSYSDTTTKVETITTGNVTGFDSSVPAVDQVLTITVGGKTTTYTITIIATPITAIAAISGTPQVGVQLTAGALTPSAATATYQWTISDTADGTYADINLATTTTYTPVADDATKFIKVVATGTGNYSGSVTSDPTTAVAAAVITIAVIPGVTTPVKNETPVATITATDQYTGSITWSPTHSPFWAATEYIATIILTAKAGFTLTGVTANFFTVDGTSSLATNDANTGVVTAVFPMTGKIAIGDNYQGGKIAYIFQSIDPGWVLGQKHGLIAAAADQGDVDTVWGCYDFAITGADGTVLGTGNQNTIDIMNITTGCPTEGIAARLCGDLVLNGYSDWFLPSMNELAAMREGLASTPTDRTLYGFADAYYWSSSEYSDAAACGQHFNNGTQENSNKNNGARVRAVRAF
ncbi:MAG: DUF1566 domain-containing protein [Planctomycetes bacterium]|nr:DUF1566 domain-containing protein [Planctomycetota bacterium]